jgi:thioredoxin reductase
MERLARFINNPIVKDGLPSITTILTLFSPAFYVAYQSQQNASNIKNLTKPLEKTNLQAETESKFLIDKFQRDQKEIVQTFQTQQKEVTQTFQKYQKETVQAIGRELEIRDDKNEIKTKALIADHSNSERWFNLSMSILTIAGVGILVFFKK